MAPKADAMMTPEQLIQDALSRFSAGRDALVAGYRLQPVSHGAVNRVTRVVSSAGDWAVRMAGPGDEALIVSRVGEHRAQTAAARLGVAPAVIYAEPHNGLLVSQWIEAPVASLELFRTAMGLSRVARQLRALHDGPVPSGLRVIDADSIVRDYLEGARAGAGPVSRTALLAAEKRSRERLKSPNPLFCHNDLHHLNVLDGSQIWFVDWEYAGVGDPLFELAGIVGYHDLNAAQTDALLAAYGGIQREALMPWVTLFDVIHALWLDTADAWDSLPLEQQTALVRRLGS
jgi:thiamine kinase-like enzyme